MKRKALSKRLRMEVFKRDGFRCQYCGASPFDASDGELQIDHVTPVSKGGTNDLMNLVSACRACNSGKSDVPLDDGTAVQKRLRQAEQLQNRRELVEMAAEWHRELASQKDIEVDVIAGEIQKQAEYAPNEIGKKSLRKLIRRFGIEAVLEAIPVSADTYLRYDNKERVTRDSWGVFFEKIGGICYMNSLPPEEREVRTVRRILMSRAPSFSAEKSIGYIKDLVDLGLELSVIRSVAERCRGWLDFEAGINAALSRAGISCE